MTRILIADDEALERKALRYIIQSSDLAGSIVIDEAENGNEAFMKATEAGYDAIFLDIKMPGLDGLATAEGLRKSGIHCPIVILSAFDTFEYAQKAIRQGVYEYLLKPAGAEDVVSALRRTLALGEDARQLSMKKEKSLSIIQDLEKKLKHAIEEQMEKGSLEASEIREFENLASLAGSERAALAMRVELKTGISSPRLTQALVRKALEEIVAEARQRGAVVLSASANDIAYILAYGLTLDQSAASLRRSGRQPSNCDPLVPLVELARKAIQDTAPALLLCGLAGPSFSPAGELFIRSVEAVRLASCEFPSVRLTPWIEANKDLDIPNSSPGLTDSARGLGLKALDYIKSNYSKTITLVMMAEQLGVNSFHLSHVISRELGIGFSELLSRVRINKAKELIAGGANIKEASYMVGFSDQAYFTRVFKKLEKMTPRSFSDKCAKKYK